jgi:hypothetical protein
MTNKMSCRKGENCHQNKEKKKDCWKEPTLPPHFVDSESSIYCSQNQNAHRMKLDNWLDRTNKQTHIAAPQFKCYKVPVFAFVTPPVFV